MLTVILAGGASRRMGRDKALLPWQGGTMLQSLIDRYAALGPVAVSVNVPGRFAFTGARELTDPYPDQGPLNGIAAAFSETGEDELFLTGTDLPFGCAALAQRLRALRLGADACVLRRGVKGTEPLFAVYGRGCLTPARTLLSQGQRSFRQLFDAVNVRYVLPGELPEFDLDRILKNVNTEEEYRACLNKAL